MLNWTIFDLLYFILFVSTFMIRWPYAMASRTNSVTKTDFGPTEKAGLFLAYLGGMVLPLAYLFTPVFNFADYRVSMASGVSGFAISLPAIWLFWRSHCDLGRQWSPRLELREAHRLIDSGVYKSIRHPMYTSIFLMGAVQALWLGNWLAGPSYLICFSVLYASRIRREEALMIERFGEEYIAYMKQSSRLISMSFLKKAWRFR